MALTSKQRADLRSRAHALKPLVHVGKEGVTPAAIRSLQQTFDTHDLIKVKVLDNAPDDVRHVLVGNHRNYTKGVGFERVAMLLGNGIIVSDGARWRSQRRMIQPAFHRGVIERFSDTMRACNARLLARWCDAADRGRAVDVTTDMSELSLEVILGCLFSEDLERLIETEGRNPFAMLVDDVTRDLAVAMRFRGLMRHVRAMVASRRAEGREPHDWLSLLMAARDKDSGEPMPMRALLDEVMTLIVAGHETTAGTLNWVWYLLGTHPDAEARLHAEVDALDGEPLFGDLARLDYARQVADEALRLYPPVWLFSRKAIGADRLGGHAVPAGADVFLSPWLMQRDPAHWSDPEAFRPERFGDVQASNLKRTAWYPFSLGSRRCIGEFFSMVDMQLHLGLVARQLSLRPRPADTVAPAVEPLINLRTRRPILMIPTRRSGAGGSPPRPVPESASEPMSMSESTPASGSASASGSKPGHRPPA